MAIGKAGRLTPPTPTAGRLLSLSLSSEEALRANEVMGKEGPGW